MDCIEGVFKLVYQATLIIHSKTFLFHSNPPQLVHKDSTSSSNSSSSGDYPSSSSPSNPNANQPHLQVSYSSTSYQMDDSYMSEEGLVFEEALRELRGVVGEEPSDDALRDILLAADMDINRAVNFYFS